MSAREGIFRACTDYFSHPANGRPGMLVTAVTGPWRKPSISRPTNHHLELRLCEKVPVDFRRNTS